MAPTPTTDWLRRGARSHPEAVALVSAAGEVSYAALDELVDRTAATLAATHGLGGGDRVGVVCVGERRVHTVTWLWATWRLGATAVVLDPARPDRERLRERWGLTAIVGEVGVGPERPGPTVGAGPGVDHSWVPTSGSSGSPRPVRLTNANVATAVTASQQRLGNGPADRWLLTLPLHHIGGLSTLWRSAAAGGAVVVHDGFEPDRVATAMRTGDVSVASLVPTMLHRILEIHPGPFAPMRAVLLGGAASSPALVARALEAGLPVLASYGMTEACSQVATVAPSDVADSLVSVGRPLQGMIVTIDRPDEDGLGEILVDGPAVSPGYAFEPPRTGPHRTGDLGRFDEAGRLVVVGRGDDLIVSGGENVAPGAVESVLAAHPGVAAVVVHGVPDTEWGEIVVAVVVPHHEGVTVADLTAHARRHLPPAQRPQRWRLAAELPLLPNGKIDRRAVLAETLDAPG